LDSHHAMKKITHPTSPSTLTRQAQATLLRKHILAYVNAQAKATEALRAINEIAMLENNGNPLHSALQGTHAVIGFAEEGYTAEPISEDELDTLMSEAEQAINASGYWSSRG
jgi:hemolysin activation/secretion protein